VKDSRPLRCRGKFLRFFPRGFHDRKYFEWERDYKWNAHEQWQRALNKHAFEALLGEGSHLEIANCAVRVESATNLLFSFEKMALRDAVKTDAGARAFAKGLFDWIHGPQERQIRFERFAGTLAQLPRRQTRVLTWPLLTVFSFFAVPKREIFLKPMTTRAAAAAYGFDFQYASKPNWGTYASLLDFAGVLQHDLADLKPRDMMDIQSFIWAISSAEYENLAAD
jgi:hypothetical protein